MSPEFGNPNPVEEAIAEAVEAIQLERQRLAEQAPWYPTYELGATANLDPRIWRIDIRETGDPEVDSKLDPPLRQLGDPEVEDQLRGLLSAGLKVRV